MTVDWSKLEKDSSTLNSQYKRTRTGTHCGFWSCSGIYAYSYNEVKEQFNFLVEKQVIKLQFDELVSDDRVAKVREAFLQLFLNSIAEPAPPPPAAATGDDKGPDARQGSGYVFHQSAIRTSYKSKSRVISLNSRLAFKKPHTLTGNLASWYDGVRDNPNCVAAVNLNDPFFQHRDIHFILDLDAKDLFEQQANYVTINVRKKRSSGNPFEDRVTIDQKFVTEKGINATVTYARGEDSNPDAYEYQTQWSFRGGVGVAGHARVGERRMGGRHALRADRATHDRGRVRSRGHEGERHHPHHGPDPLPEARRRGRGEHQRLARRATKRSCRRRSSWTATRAATPTGWSSTPRPTASWPLPWSAKMGDDYVYASIPKDMLSVPQLKSEAQEAARTVMTSAKDKVLSKFNELVGGIK